MNGTRICCNRGHVFDVPEQQLALGVDCNPESCMRPAWRQDILGAREQLTRLVFTKNDMNIDYIISGLHFIPAAATALAPMQSRCVQVTCQKERNTLVHSNFLGDEYVKQDLDIQADVAKKILARVV